MKSVYQTSLHGVRGFIEKQENIPPFVKEDLNRIIDIFIKKLEEYGLTEKDIKYHLNRAMYNYVQISINQSVPGFDLANKNINKELVEIFDMFVLALNVNSNLLDFLILTYY